MFIENIKFLRKHKNLTQEALAEALGMKRSAYKEYELGKEPGADLIMKLARYFAVSADDLLDKKLSAYPPNQIPRPYVAEEERLRVLAITVTPDEKENIEFVPVKAKAGYLSGYANPEYLSSLRHITLPNTFNGTYRAFEIEGDSMPPLRPGSVFIGRYMENIRDVKNHRTYILVTKEDGVVCKKVINNADRTGKLVLYSNNPHYPPYTISVAEVQEAWQYHAHINFGDYEEGMVPDAVVTMLADMAGEVENMDNIMSSIKK